MSESVQAAALGVVEGLTEFVPVSSTGHLILFGDLIGFHSASAETFEIFIQLGAILAVVVLYLERFLGLLELDATEGFKGRQGLIKLFLACLPALALGFCLHEHIKSLFQPLTVALALIIGGIVMILVERLDLSSKVEKPEELSYKTCFLTGCFQCFALWPGMSRSGSTIVGGMVLGMSRKLAAEFSFLVAVPVMCAAVGYDLLKSYDVLGVKDILPFAIGFIVSFVVAIFAIKFLLAVLQRYSLAPFGWYRIVLGIIVLGVLYL